MRAAAAVPSQMPAIVDRPGNLDAASSQICSLRRLCATRVCTNVNDVVRNECDDVERIVTALRHFDLHFGCHASLLFDFIGSSPDQIPNEFDPSAARIHGTDLRALLRLMRM